MPTNTQFSPKNDAEFESKSLNADNRGLFAIATKNSTTNHDLQLLHDYILTGGIFRVLDGAEGDKVSLQVIDKDNVMGLGSNVVLGQYVTDWYVDPTTSLQCDLSHKYPAKIFAGLYLRVVYTSVGTTTDPRIILNYKLHKVLW